MSNRDGIFDVKLRKYDRLLWHVAKAYEIPGVLPREDLYQEGLIVLDGTVEVDEEHVLSESFARELRNNLKYRMAKARRHHLQEKRDWRATVPFIGDPVTEVEVRNTTPFGPPQTSKTVSAVFAYAVEQEAHPDPEQIVTDKEDALEARAFIDTLRDGVDDTSKIVMDRILSPDDLPPALVESYKRVPKHMSQEMLAQLLGWDRSKVKRALERIRRAARKLQLEQTHVDRGQVHQKRRG